MILRIFYRVMSAQREKIDIYEYKPSRKEYNCWRNADSDTFVSG